MVLWRFVDCRLVRLICSVLLVIESRITNTNNVTDCTYENKDEKKAKSRTIKLAQVFPLKINLVTDAHQKVVSNTVIFYSILTNSSPGCLSDTP